MQVELRLAKGERYGTRSGPAEGSLVGGGILAAGDAETDILEALDLRDGEAGGLEPVDAVAIDEVGGFDDGQVDVSDSTGWSEGAIEGEDSVGTGGVSGEAKGAGFHGSVEVQVARRHLPVLPQQQLPERTLFRMRVPLQLPRISARYHRRCPRLRHHTSHAKRRRNRPTLPRQCQRLPHAFHMH